jgi:putative PIN family toxin of toxin-antitoxin system
LEKGSGKPHRFPPGTKNRDSREKIAVNIPLKLVLDTNIVLDWLLFDDPGMSLFRHDLRHNRLVVFRHPPASIELARVLAYQELKLDPEKQAKVYAAYQTQTTSARLPATFSMDHLMLPAGFPSCRDADDQHFLALAYHASADALVSRDKAVLSVGKRAEKFGVRVVGVEQLNALLGELLTV